MAEHVTLSQQSTYLREQFNRFDNTLMNMFESLDSALAELEHPDRYSHAQMFDIVIGAEYLIVRVRAKILSELAKIQCALSASTTTTGVEKLFKDRYNNIIAMCQRVNELREDFAVVQRSMWARNQGRL